MINNDDKNAWPCCNKLIRDIELIYYYYVYSGIKDYNIGIYKVTQIILCVQYRYKNSRVTIQFIIIKKGYLRSCDIFVTC